MKMNTEAASDFYTVDALSVSDTPYPLAREVIRAFGRIGPNSDLDLVVRMPSPLLTRPPGIVGAMEIYPGMPRYQQIGRVICWEAERKPDMSPGSEWPFRGVGIDAPVRVRVPREVLAKINR
jgi:hypothetical protein